MTETRDPRTGETRRTPDATRAELEDLIVLALEALEDGGEAALDALLAGHEARAADVRAALEKLQVRGLTPRVDRSAEPRPPSIRQRLGDYALLEPLGGGGMGVVYLARDERLDREVALKVMRPETVHVGAARERFAREIRAIADLKHPGIVPLFGGGEDDGVPYYAMERVTGCTLAETIGALVGQDPAQLDGGDLRTVVEERSAERDGNAALFDGPWETVCLRIVGELADALEYAHRRGVVHRDVKPSNVMVTPSGRVQLFDFGLSSTGDGSHLTKSGTPLGTLAYMAPEVLRGDASSEDSRLDVYSLGVTLFELLSLELPYATEAELRAAVHEGREAPRLRERAPRASWEAEVLCQVAMDPDPERRFASAGDFAHDVRRALAGLPLEARPPGPGLRVRRWAARHPAFAALLTVLVAVLVAGPTTFAVQERKARLALGAQRDVIERQRAELALALDEARSQEARAEANFERALAAVDTMLTRIGAEELRDVPGLHEVRRDVLEEALAFFEAFLEERGDDPELRRESARAWRRVGDIRGWLNDKQGSAEALAASIALLKELAEESPDDARIQADLLESATMRAVALRQIGRLADALASLDVAREAEAALDAATTPRAATLAARRLDAGIERAEVLRALGRRAEALDCIGPALQGLESLHAAHPEDLDLTSQLAKAHNTRAGLLTDGAVLASQKDPDVVRAAMVHHERIAELLAPVLTSGSGAQPRAQLARALLNRASLGLGIVETSAVMADLEEAVERFDELVADYPGADVYLDQRGLAWMALGSARLLDGDTAGGLESLESAISDLRQAVERKPDQPEPHVQLGSALLQHAMSTWQRARDTARAAELMAAAAEFFEAALDRWPDLDVLRSRAAYALEFRCVLWLEVEQVERALAGIDAWTARLEDSETAANGAFYTAKAAALVEARGELQRAAELDALAAQHLERAIQRGFDVERFEHEPVWSALLERPEASAPLQSK